MDRRTLTMNWDGLGEDDDDDRFFESCDRLSSAVSIDLASSDSDDDDDIEGGRISFASAVSSASSRNVHGRQAAVSQPSHMFGDYDLWMAEPGDIKERRKRLLQGMGLSSNKDLLRIASAKFVRALSTKADACTQNSKTKVESCPPEESKEKPSPDRKVTDWMDLHEMVTAARYTPDGQGAIIGSHKGSCRRYTISDCKLEYKDLVEVQNKKKSQAKKVTGFEFHPSKPAEVLITSADSRIRIFDGSDVIHKFRGFRNTSSQISASFSPEGKYVISASEDSQVYIWKREEPRNAGSRKGKTKMRTNAHEHFQCKDVSVAVPWPGSIKYEPPVVQIHSKRNSKRFIPPPYPSSSSPTREHNTTANCRRNLPPLPKKNTILERSMSCPDKDFAQSARIDSGLDQSTRVDSGSTQSAPIDSSSAQCTRVDSDSAQLARMDSGSRIDSGIGVGDSFNSAVSSSITYGDSPSISASGSSPSQSWTSSWSLIDGGGTHGANTAQATAWGLVIVTASLGGDIRVYQNFGLPLKVSRQTNLFRDHS